MNNRMNTIGIKSNLFIATKSVRIFNLSKSFNYTTYLFSKEGEKRICSEIYGFMNWGPAELLLFQT